MISIYSFDKYFLSAYHVPGTSATDREVNQSIPQKYLPSWSFYLNKGRQKIKIINVSIRREVF